jgi:RNA polymerase sigma-54 factor
MALEQKLSLKIAQKLVMTPSLQQAIKLLQLSRLELEQAIGQEMVENPVLEVNADGEEGPAERAGETESEVETEGSETSLSDIDVEAFFSDYIADSSSEGPSMSFSSDNEQRLENVASEPMGLSDHLLWQLHLLDCSSELVPIAEFIIGNLDENGFLSITEEEIAEATRATPGQVAEAIQLVRSLDPPGIATSSTQECLLVQLDILDAQGAIEEIENGALENLRHILAEHWDDLLHQRWSVLAEDLGCSIDELKPIIEVVRRLDPKPGRMFYHERNYYVEPDVYVAKADDEYVITLNDDGLPRLRISSQYRRMLEGEQLDSSASSYLREKMRSALWLMKSIDQRQRTIYKVARSIVDHQRGFFEHGLEHLKPMVLRDVAEDIGMHESTVSRVVSNKYMHTPRGLFPMKYFFHSGVDSARGGNVSSLVVKERIRKLIESEDPGRPLSDSKIMKLLQREGIRLARRTVAKYREEIGVPSSDQRKRAF